MKILQLRQEIERQKELLRKQVGSRVKQYREENKMTQEELARSVGIERTSVTNIEAGRNNMTLEQLMMFCEIFEITPNDMLCLSES